MDLRTILIYTVLFGVFFVGACVEAVRGNVLYVLLYGAGALLSLPQVTATILAVQVARSSVGYTPKGNRITEVDVAANILCKEFLTHTTVGGQVLRWCVITTRSGFAVTGKPSACVDPANDDKAIGEEQAYKNALDELWPLMGYALKNELAKA